MHIEPRIGNEWVLPSKFLAGEVVYLLKSDVAWTSQNHPKFSARHEAQTTTSKRQDNIASLPLHDTPHFTNGTNLPKTSKRLRMNRICPEIDMEASERTLT